MSRYKLSAPARQGLRGIREYIAEMPGKGHTREDLSDLPVRFWPVGAYLVVYDPGKRPVEILRILHGARDVETILENQ